jgi:hypothetical protein
MRQTAAWRIHEVRTTRQWEYIGSKGGILTYKKIIISFAWCLFLIAAPVQALLHAQTAVRNPLNLSADHATVSVSDWDKECQWYQHVLGFYEFKPAKREADKKICYLNIPGYRVDILWQKGSVRHQLTTGSLEQGWLNLEFNSSDRDVVYKYLIKQGIKVEIGGEGNLKFLDPEGNEIGINKP